MAVKAAFPAVGLMKRRVVDMGMFDYLECEYPLPGNPPKWALYPHQFQTKSLACGLFTYTIEADGSLTRTRELYEGDSEEPEIEKRALQNYTGEVVFYSSNIKAVGPGTYTRNGEDAESLEYKALFVRGQLISIEVTEHTSTPAATYRMSFVQMTAAEQEEQKRRQAESLLGRELYVRYGGSQGYFVSVALESEHELVVQGADGRYQILSRSARDVTFFDSPEDEAVRTAKRKADWQRRKEEHDAEIASRKA